MDSRFSETLRYWPWRCVRLPVLAFVAIFSAVAFGSFLALLLLFSENGDTFTGNMGSVFGALTFTSIGIMVIADYIWPGRVLSWLAVELGWFSTVGLMWAIITLLATGFGTEVLSGLGCEPVTFGVETPCEFWRIVAVSQVFSFLNALTLLGYIIFLILAMRTRRRRGHVIVWTATVRDTDFLAWKSKGPSKATFPITKYWPWNLVRVPILSFTTVTSLVILGASAYALPEGDFQENSHYRTVALIASCFTITSVIPMLVVDYIRPGSILSWVAVEIGWFFIISMLWSACMLTTLPSGLTAIYINDFTLANDGADLADNLIIVFGAINSILYILYLLFLIIFGVILKKHRGHKVIWTATVRDTDFLERKRPPPLRTEKHLDIEMTDTSSTLSGRLDTADESQGSTLGRDEVPSRPNVGEHVRSPDDAV